MALSKNAKVAFIGTGIMGAPIAEHLISAGYDVTVYNRTPEKAQKLVSLGAHVAESVKDAAKDADVVFTMVGYPTDVEDVYLATDGLIRVAKKGAYLIDLTTSSSQLARDIHDAAEIEGKHAFDCPVTGGQKGAQDGTLTLIVGATENDVEPVRALLETFSAKIFCMGGAGKGQTAKLCNQVSLASCMIGYADAMALAEQGGLDVEQMLEVVAISRLRETSSQDFWPSTSARILRLLLLSLRTLRLPSLVQKLRLPSMTCSARSVALARALRQSHCFMLMRLRALQLVLTGHFLRARKMRVSTSAAVATTTKMVITSVSAMVTDIIMSIIMSMKVTSTVMTATAATKC